MEKSEIRYILRERKNGMYKDTYIVVYKSGRVFFCDLRKTGHMAKTHFEFMMNARCIPHYDSRTGAHTSDKFVCEDYKDTIKL